MLGYQDGNSLTSVVPAVVTLAVIAPTIPFHTLILHTAIVPCTYLSSVLLFRGLLEKELEAMGIRLNKRAPNIYFKVSQSLLGTGCLSKGRSQVST